MAKKRFSLIIFPFSSFPPSVYTSAMLSTDLLIIVYGHHFAQFQ